MLVVLMDNVLIMKHVFVNHNILQEEIVKFGIVMML